MARLRFYLRRTWFTLILAALLVAVAANLFVAPRGPRDLVALRAKRSQLEAMAARLEADNEALRNRIARLTGDDRYIQRLIRQELGYVGTNELVYRFPRAVAHRQGINGGER